MFFCTSPWIGSNHCVPEKVEWIKSFFGIEGVKKLIITKDKTLIKGDILIDDKPKIKGLIEPEWEQIYFERPYNQNIKSKRKIKKWEDWEKVILNNKRL